MHFFDSHAHLSSQEVLPMIDAVLTRANVAQVNHILNICTCPKTLGDGLLLQERFEGIRNAGATTPHDVQREGESAFAIFRKACISGIFPRRRGIISARVFFVIIFST